MAGQTAVICENLRAIYEPLNFNRRIFLFDTFKGYKGFSDKDNKSKIYKDGTYSVGLEYAKFLEKLLIEHEKSNAMGHNHSKHKVIIGDCIHTILIFLKNPNQVLSLVFIDINSFDPLNKVMIIMEKNSPWCNFSSFATNKRINKGRRASLF